jgi:thioesterase domain-containing protein
MAGAADRVLRIRTAGAADAGSGDAGSGEPRAPLYCVHPISGSAYSYLPLGRLLPAGRQVCGLEAPGYDDAAAPLSSVADLAADYVEFLLSDHGLSDHGLSDHGLSDHGLSDHGLSDHGREPVSLLGWSFGGVVAHEMAVRLTRSGVQVPVLIMIDAWQPEDEPMPVGRALLEWFLSDLMAAAQLDGAETERVLAAVPESGDLYATLRGIEESGSPLADLGGQLLRRRYAVFCAHLRALYEHRPATDYPGRTVFVRSAASPPAHEYWRRIIPRFSLRVVPGDHYSIWRPAEVAGLAATVTESLEEAVVP